jgi:hypothetical protein
MVVRRDLPELRSTRLCSQPKPAMSWACRIPKTMTIGTSRCVAHRGPRRALEWGTRHHDVRNWCRRPIRLHLHDRDCLDQS